MKRQSGLSGPRRNNIAEVRDREDAIANTRDACATRGIGRLWNTLLLRKGTSCIHIRELKRAPLDEFTPIELRQLRALKTPAGVQRFLDSLSYHLADTAWSPRKVLQKKTAHCLEGAIFAAAALRVLGFPPLLWDLEAVNDTDHVLAIFKVRGCWGAVAKSNFSGCRYREPVYRTLRELAMSYFNIYFNLRSERTLRRYSQPVDLSRFDDRDWMTSARSIWFIPEYLCAIPHTPLLTPAQARQLTRLDQRSRAAEMVGHRKKP